MDGINYIDIVVLALVVVLGLKGIVNGFIREFFGLAGIIGGVYIASRNAENIGEWVSENLYAFENEAALTLAGFVLVLAAVWVACLLLAEAAVKLVKLSALGGIDRLLGFLFASGKIFMVFSVIAYALSNVEIIRSNLARYTDSSFIYPLLVKAGGEVVKIDSVESLTKRASEAASVPEIPQNQPLSSE